MDFNTPLTDIALILSMHKPIELCYISQKTRLHIFSLHLDLMIFNICITGLLENKTKILRNIILAVHVTFNGMYLRLPAMI